VVIILGFFAFFQWEFSLSVLAAVLAVLGYSVNESVVIFDRIRENLPQVPQDDTPQVIDHAITSTMSRTIITHGSTQMMVLSMLLFGGPTLHYFALALTIGILFGIYSSVFVAAAIAMWLGVKREDLVKHSITAPSSLELLDTEVLEHKIIASRLANELMEAAAKDVNHLRRRLKSLAGDQELAASDLVHPEVLLLPVVAQWEGAGLSRGNWERVQPLIHAHFKEHLQAVYTKCNAELIEQGVLPHIEQPAPRSNPSTGASASEGSGLSATGDARSEGSAADRRGNPGSGPPRRRLEDRAQGILEQVGRILGGFFNPEGVRSQFQPPSAPLLKALAQQPVLSTPSHDTLSAVDPTVIIQRVVQELRQQSVELKASAETQGEKSIIEMVALMFQSILQEDRIPTGVRVWFARLQMPVLRVALAEPLNF
jgi:hypothetical protein